MNAEGSAYPPQDPLATGLKGRCPRCGGGQLFSGFLTLAKRCEACGLDFSFADSADGPAFFIMTAVGFVVAAAAVVMELAYMPPVWVHVVLWGPLILLLSLLLLRPLKGVMVAQQFARQAREGSIRHDD